MKRLITVLVLLAGFAPGSWASCTIVQAVAHAACTSGSTTCSVVAGDGLAAIGAGHAVVVWTGSVAASITMTSASDSGGSTYGSCANCAGSDTVGTTSSDIQYTLNALSSTSVTCNRSASGTNWTCGVVEISTTTSLLYDTSNNVDDSASSTSLSGVGLTLTGGNDCITQVLAASGSTINSITTYTLNGGATNRKSATLANTASGTAPTWTMSAGAKAAGSALALKESGVAPPGKNSMLPLMGVGQ